jgi:hypothetical protein
MNLEKYKLIKGPEKCYYHFLSDGPKGQIEKVIEFYEIHSNIYNLAFGDVDKMTGRINDTITSNNNDRDKVLATVAGAVIDFMEEHPGAILFAEGSTQARTRLYQMGISKFWDEISITFEINGFAGDGWKPFKKGENYESFLLRLK